MRGARYRPDKRCGGAGFRPHRAPPQARPAGRQRVPPPAARAGPGAPLCAPAHISIPESGAFYYVRQRT